MINDLLTSPTDPFENHRMKAPLLQEEELQVPTSPPSQSVEALTRGLPIKQNVRSGDQEIQTDPIPGNDIQISLLSHVIKSVMMGNVDLAGPEVIWDL